MNALIVIIFILVLSALALLCLLFAAGREGPDEPPNGKSKDMKTITHPAGSLDPVIGPIGGRDDYERDVAEAQKAYDANPSSMNHEDLFAAKRALRRHWPNVAVERAPAKDL